ncbi:efflux RND transporter periplasmic adaptor subunit [Roseomonas elaeocarpi]|uniref:Efflux RND transporter periplasmic adaptor subunit n=1 Tax=Roseomonas elaeocarpi TaxID=907779 RepID=A0ABV6JXP7_9PROT
MKRGAWFLLAGVVVLAGAGYAWHHYGLPPFSKPAATASQPAPVEVQTAEVRRETLPVTTEYTGTVVAPLDVELRARVTGTVVERSFNPGAAVKRGDILFRIDPRPFQAALLAAQAQQSQAQATLDFAREQLERYRPLTRQGYASDEKLDEVSRDRDTANGQLQAAQAQIAQQQLNLEYSVIRAPFDGRTGITDIVPGDLVSADTTALVTVAQMDPIEIQVALSSDDLRALTAAQGRNEQAKILLLGADGKPNGREAEVVKIDNRFNPRTARSLVRSRLGNADASLTPGDFVRVQVQAGQRDRILVPSVALATRLNQRIVYVVEDNKTVHTRPVQVEAEFGDNTAVRDLEPGTVIATNNLQRLREGQEVKPAAANDRHDEGPETAARNTERPRGG